MLTKQRFLTMLVAICFGAILGMAPSCSTAPGPIDDNPPPTDPGDDPGDDNPDDDDPGDDDPDDDDPGDDDPADDDPGDDDPGDDDPGDDDPGDDDPGDDDPDDPDVDTTGTLQVTAGADRTVIGATDVTLTCTQTDGPVASRLLWHQTAGTDVGIDGANTATVTFATPTTSDTLSFTCEAQLDGASSPPDAVTVNVRTLTVTLLTKEGDNAPNTLAVTDGKFDAIDTSIVRVSASDVVAFRSLLSDTLNADGIFTAGGGTIAAVARMNDTAPGTNGRAYASFQGISINDTGEVAFTSIINLSSARGVFLDEGLTTTLLGFQSQADGPNGETYETLSAGVALDRFSDVRVTGQLNRSGHAQIVAHVGSAAQLIFTEASDAPGTGEKFTAFGTTTRNVAASQNGHFAFTAQTATNAGIFLAPRPGFLQAVALNGQAAPDGGSYNWTDHDNIVLDIHDSADVHPYIAFIVPLADDAATHKLIRTRQGAGVTIVAAGDSTPDGVDTFAAFDSIAVNADGHVAFTAATSAGVTALYFHDAVTCSVIEVAAVGQSVPGGGTFSQFYAADLNDADTIAFIADISTGKTGVFKAQLP